ncbi:MAG: HAMP domain-containing sensor histidine kinase [Gracilimonas sp.]
MTVLKQYIDGVSNPVFITDRSYKILLHSNPPAKNELNSDTNTKLVLDEHIKLLHQKSGAVYVELNHKWYQAATQDIELEDKSVKILELRKIEGIPDNETLDSWKSMIAVMLHRLRSPLTGINGYLDMLEDENKDEQLNKRFEAIHKGFNNIYDLMDELEILYNIPTGFDDSKFIEVELEAFIERLIINYEPELRERITINLEQNITINTNPEWLKNIISILLDNALQHSESSVKLIYSLDNNGQITVQNEGSLPLKISNKIYHPFVTTRATNLGIGLTKAILYVQQIGGIIFHSDDNNSVSFTLQLPLLN